MINKVFVTGCTGLVGHGISYYLLNTGYQVYGTSRTQLLSRHPRFQAIQLELTDRRSIRRLEPHVHDQDVIIHSAAKVPRNGNERQDWNEYFETNCRGTYELLELAIRRKIKQLVLISSIAIVDQTNNPIVEEAVYRPLNFYHSSKIAAEIACQQYIQQGKLKIAILRISAPFGYVGSREAVIPRFIDWAKKSQDLPIWGTGTRRQTFTFVEDIGLACELAIRKSCSGTYNITGPSSSTMTELAEQVLRVFRTSRSRITFSNVPDPEEGKSVTISVQRAEKELDYVPKFSVVDGLAKIAQLDGSLRFFEPC